jgi:hypothetical protein
VVLALALGWGLKSWVEAQRTEFTSHDGGLTVYYPPSWVLMPAVGLEFEARNPASGVFATAYRVSSAPVPPGGPATTGLAAALTDSSLRYAQEGSAYRLLELASRGELEAGPAMEAEYAYVAEDPDPLAAQLPVVVRGLDVAVQGKSVVYVFTLLADQAQFDDAVADFRRFVETAELR